jgi:hypothetical protein
LINPIISDALFSKQWVIYAKKPFRNASSVVEYLGRYTHKIAISNHRIISADKNQVTFRMKDYRKNGKNELWKPNVFSWEELSQNTGKTNSINNI